MTSPEEGRALNRLWWDERTPLHVASAFYDVEGFRAGRETLRPFELDALGDVSGLRLAHLQCHFGLDSMGWARHGASVVGLDFSQPAVDTANALADELGLDARFVCSDVYDAEAALGEQFDVVYTGFGAIGWLDDLDRWARVVASLIRPGGRLLLTEFHPFSWVFGGEPHREHYEVVDDYFGPEPFVDDEEGSYGDQAAATRHNTTVNYQHSLGEIFRVLLGVGLTIDSFEEFDHTLFPQFPWLVQDGEIYLQPEGSPRIPLMFALVAHP